MLRRSHARGVAFCRHHRLHALSRYAAAQQAHVHVYYGEYEASVGVDGELLAGSLPRRQLKIVVGWLALHEEEVYAAWNRAVQGEHFDRIPGM